MRDWRIGLAAAAALLLGAADELKPGLQAQYYDLEKAIEDFPTLSADRAPTLTRVDKAIHFESTDEAFGESGLSEHFYVRWVGLLRVPKDGTYTFYTESDDGSRLWIDGKLVVDNGGLHGMEERSGDIALKAGDREIKLEFFENEGSAGCKLSWEGPDRPKELVPASALFHKVN